MEEVKYISSIAEFLSWVEETRPHGEISEHALFYRGHSDKNYTLEPTVYRLDNQGKSFRAVEHPLYEEMLRHSPTAFAEDRNLFERLVRMQHHGLPTRLLDLTLSPLVALYFACNSHASQPKAASESASINAEHTVGQEESGKDGEVIFFPRQRFGVLHPSDIPEAALAGIERYVDLSSIATQVTTKLCEHLKESRSWPLNDEELQPAFVMLLDKCIDLLDRTTDVSDLLDTATAVMAIENAMRTFGEQWNNVLNEKKTTADSITLKLNAAEILVGLQKCIHQFDGYVARLIEVICEGLRLGHNTEKCSLSKFFNQFTQYHFVYPPINSERIRRQQGAFLICPPGKTRQWSINNMQPNSHRVRIRADTKTRLLKELSYLGITHSYIYPDLNATASDAKACYPAVTDPPATGLRP